LLLSYFLTSPSIYAVLRHIATFTYGKEELPLPVVCVPVAPTVPLDAQPKGILPSILTQVPPYKSAGETVSYLKTMLPTGYTSSAVMYLAQEDQAPLE
jgi:hypothetical protein